MQNKTFINLGLCVLFLLLGIFSGSAQNGGDGKDLVQLGNWLNPMTNQRIDFEEEMTILLFEDATLVVQVGARTAAGTPMNEFPDLYIQYSFGNNSGIAGPLTDADFFPLKLKNGEEGQEARIEYTFQFVDECNNLANSEGIFEVPVSIHVVTLVGGNYVPYPVVDYPLLFPEGWFENSTDPYPDPIMDAIKLVDCLGPTAPSPRRQEGTTIAKDLSNLQIKSVSPNPFSSNLELRYNLNKTSDVNIRVFDAMGKLHFQENQFSRQQGSHVQLFPLEELSSGLYYMQVTSEGMSKTIKMVKN